MIILYTWTVTRKCKSTYSDASSEQGWRRVMSGELPGSPSGPAYLLFLPSVFSSLFSVVILQLCII